MAARKGIPVKLNLPVDERTASMTDEALYCRRYGHKWAEKAQGRKRFLELIALGQQEEIRYCDNGCKATWGELWDLYTGDVLETSRDYPRGGDYLMPPGSGRLKRSQARVAMFARQHKAYV